MIWSIISDQEIFAETGTPQAALRSIDYLGRRLLVRRGADGQGEIVSVLSTDPADFLDGRLAPGTRIRM